MEIKKHKTWKKRLVKSFAEARKVFLYRGQRRILDFLSLVDVATMEDIARATLLSENILKRKYLRELETIGFIKRLTQGKVTLYFLQKWGMYKIVEERKGLDDLQKRKLKKIAKGTGLFSQTEAFAQPDHQILNAKVGAELFRAHLLAEKQAQEGNILELLNKRNAKRFIKLFFESRGKIAKGVPIPDFMLEGNKEVIFVEAETRENKKERLKEKFFHYEFLAEEFTRQYKVCILFVVDTEKDKVRWVRKAVKAQERNGDKFSFTVKFSRKLVDIAELREWLGNWQILEEQEDRFGFISFRGEIFDLKSLEETNQISALEIAIKKKEDEKERVRKEEEQREREEEQRRGEEQRKKWEEEAEERKREEEEKKKAECEEKSKEFSGRFTKFDYDREENVKEEAKELNLTRSQMRDSQFKVEVDGSNVYVLLEFEDFVNLTTRTRYKLECSQKVREGEECKIISFENRNGNNLFNPIPLIREFSRPLQKVIKEGVQEAVLNAQKETDEEYYGIYSIYFYLSE